MKLSTDIQATMAHFHNVLDVNTNFDIVYHTITIGGRQACLYFVDGFTKDEVLLKLMQGWVSLKPEDMPKIPHDFATAKLVLKLKTAQFSSSCSPVSHASLSTATTNASPSTVAPIRPAAFPSRKKTKFSAVPEMVSSKH